MTEQPPFEPFIVSGVPHKDCLKNKKYGFLSSGGDSPGMNPAVRALVRIGIYSGAQMFAIMEGYEGLIHDDIHNFTWDSVGGILPKGGTIIGTARSAEFRTKEGRKKAAFNLVKRGIDCLIVIGGDGSLTGADIFRREWSEYLTDLVKEGKIPAESAVLYSQLTIVGLVGSIDNDMCGTDMTIGCDTALHRITSCVDAILSTATSHKRSFIVEVMGRNCGWLALTAALSTGCEYVLVPEAPPEEGWEDKMCGILQSGRCAGRRCSFVIICEGSIDRKGKPITAAYVKQILDTKLGHDTRVTTLGHVQRGGTPSAYDRLMSTLLGAACINASVHPLVQGKSVYIGCRGFNTIVMDLMTKVKETQSIPKLIANGEYQKAQIMRGDDFVDSWECLHTLLRLEASPSKKPTNKKIAILHAGAPAPGMNTIVRGLIRLGWEAGHQMFVYNNGFGGLQKGILKEMKWMDVTGWVLQGGANIGTTRQPLTEDGIPFVVEALKKADISALIMVGGYDGYGYMDRLASIKDLQNISMLCIPASISNNIPGTDISVGADTALNNIQDAVDKIKASAVGTRRVFMIEVMGGTCGFLALSTGLITGAERVYTHEEGINLKGLTEDLSDTKKRFCENSTKAIALMINCEGASKTYTTQFLKSLFEAESEDLWDVRAAVLGHLQQGGSPSPFDRILGTRLANYAIELLSEENTVYSGGVGIVSGQLVFNTFQKLGELTNAKFRRPNEQWWMKHSLMGDILAMSPGSDHEIDSHKETSARRQFSLSRKGTESALPSYQKIQEHQEQQQKELSAMRPSPSVTSLPLHSSTSQEKIK